jgi:cytoskeleton protein RodZ
MKRTGESLKNERLKKNISLNEVSLSLKISSKILKAIEEGEDTNLPAKTFLRGFVLSYASFLKMNTEEVLNVFYEEMGSTRPQVKIEPEHGQISNTDSLSPETSKLPKIEFSKPQSSQDDFVAPVGDWTTKRKIFVFGGSLVLILLIMLSKQIIEKYENESKIEAVVVGTPLNNSTPAEPAKDLAAADSTLNPAQNLVGGLSTPATTDSNNPTQPPANPTPEPTSATTAAAAPAEATQQPAAKTTANAALTAPTPKEEATAVAPPKPTPPAATSTPPPTQATANADENKKPVELIIEALDNVSIEFLIDGKKEKLNLKADEVHTIKSKTGVNLNVSNGGAINLIVNGKEKGVPGSLGKPLKMSF